MKSRHDFTDQYKTSEERMKSVNRYVLDKFFQIIIWILSFLALAGITWIHFNGPKVDEFFDKLFN